MTVMANRFARKKRRDYSLIKSMALPVLVFLAVGSLFIFGIESLTARTRGEQLASVESAVTRAAVQCYAIEGQYPPSLDYLRDNYGLSVDLERYIVDYRAFASNIMPVITVLPKDFTDPAMESGGDFVIIE